MTEWTYTIYDDYNSVNAVASGMTLDVALLLLKALCEKYACEPNLQFTIERETFDTKAADDERYLGNGCYV